MVEVGLSLALDHKILSTLVQVDSQPKAFTFLFVQFPPLPVSGKVSPKLCDFFLIMPSSPVIDQLHFHMIRYLVYLSMS